MIVAVPTENGVVSQSTFIHNGSLILLVPARSFVCCKFQQNATVIQKNGCKDTDSRCRMTVLNFNFLPSRLFNQEWSRSGILRKHERLNHCIPSANCRDQLIPGDNEQSLAELLCSVTHFSVSPGISVISVTLGQCVQFQSVLGGQKI